MNKFTKQCLKNVGIAVLAMTVVIIVAFLAVFLSKTCTNDKNGQIIIALLLISIFVGIFVTILNFYSDRRWKND